MLISHSHRFVFIHVYKTGGTSISAALQPLCEPLDAHPFHLTAVEAIERLGPSVWRDYLSFAVVRNPWDWIVSLYSWLRDNAAHDLSGFVRELGFPGFVQWLDDFAGGDRQPPSQHGSWGDYRRPQTTWILDAGGRQIVDRVLRFERLAEDFAELQRDLGIVAWLDRLNTSDHPPYYECYDHSTREIVGRLFAADVARFGYEF
ncbi:MAG: sulfotransferase family 2 domain-containing protein [Planctomycetaceae bacterium]|nr:sulfotransferase family 2 domain-containing protein [Planctomycetaceae bacterium]